MIKSKIVVSFLTFACIALQGQNSSAQTLVDVEAFDTFRYTEIFAVRSGDRSAFQDAGHCFIQNPKTVEGRLISNNGWAVTSEVEIANYTFVSFNGRIEIGTSGTCWKSDGNIAVFRNSELLGLIHTTVPTDYVIGSIELQEGGVLRVHSGDPSALPILDIKYRGDFFSLSEVGEFTTYCEGRYVVPNVYGKGIYEARDAIIRLGWRPDFSITGVENIGFIAMSLREEGVLEAVGCAPSGMGYCSFEYIQGDARLSVSSIEQHSIYWSGVECDQTQ